MLKYKNEKERRTSVKINYFSPAHLLYLAIAAGLVVGFYFIFRRKSFRTQRIAVLSIVLVNVIQHIFKLQIYPMYSGGFDAICTAYNMCALLILLSPFAHFIRLAPLRDFVYYIGTSAGIVALLVPYWNVGQDAFTWEFFRFFFCHALLLLSSVLPLLFGHHKPSWRRFPFVGLAFFAGIGIIILNDIVMIKLGMYGVLSADNLYESLLEVNPIWAFGPPEGFEFVLKIVGVFTPGFLLGKNGGAPVPVLWYVIPYYLLISVIAFAIFAAADKSRFLADFSRLKAKLKAMRK